MSYLFYQLEAGFLLFTFFIIYQVIVRKSTLFGYKRLFILASVLLSFVVPFLKIRISQPEIVSYYQMLPEAIVGSDTVKSISEVNYLLLLSLLAIMGSVVFVFIFVIQLFRIVRLIKTSPKERFRGYKVIEANGLEAFTFFRYIFLGRDIPEANRDTILHHELIHVKRLHSIDIAVINFFLFIQWFNPVIWLFRRLLKENHEFEADASLLKRGIAVEDYQQLLLNQIFQTRGVQFSSFNYNSFIKNRIQMMTKSSVAGKTRFLLATMISFIVVTAFTFKAEVVTDDLPVLKRDAVKSSNAITAPVFKDTVKEEAPFIVVDQMATFNGKGLEEFNAYIIKNLKYPDEAVKQKMKGKVYVQFEVDKRGEVAKVKILKSSGFPVLDEEAYRVIKSSPLWSPAKRQGKFVGQLFTLPVVFALVK